MVYFKYITSLWSKKIGGQIISFLYTIPVLFFVICSLMTNFMPIVSNILFQYHSSYNYCYTIPCSKFSIEHRENIKNPIAYHYMENNNNTLLQINSVIINAGVDESISDTRYENISSVKLYVARQDTLIENTFFTKDNFVDNYPINRDTDNNIAQLFLTYNTVNYLDLKHNEQVKIKLLNEKDIDLFCKYVGTIKPDYNGSINSDGNSSVNNSFTEYNQYAVFNALLIVDESMFYKIVEKTDDVSVIVFSNKEIDFSDFEINAELVNADSKSNYINKYKEAALQSNFLSKSIIKCIVLALIVVVIITLEFGFFNKKNREDMIVLSMLGMKKKVINNIVLTDIVFKFLLSTIFSVLLCKFIYFKFIFNMYCDNYLLAIVSSFIIFVGIVYILVRRIFLK